MVEVHFLVPLGCVHLQCFPSRGAFVSQAILEISQHSQFRLELAKELIGGYSGRKRYGGKKRKATPFDNALSLPNLPGHSEVKLKGRKRACMNCSLHGHRNPSGRTPETVYGCNRFSVHLCRGGCFLEFHTENSHA